MAEHFFYSAVLFPPLRPPTSAVPPNRENFSVFPYLEDWIAFPLCSLWPVCLLPARLPAAAGQRQQTEKRETATAGAILPTTYLPMLPPPPPQPLRK